MAKSHAAGWPSDSPTPAQLKELFSQIASGKVTKEHLQVFLRGEDVPEKQQNRHAKEEVSSTRGYPKGYAPKPIPEQIATLVQFFPSLKPETIASIETLAPLLPNWVEARFAIPKWEKVADTYGKAVAKVLAIIGETRRGKFCNFLKGKLGQQYLRQHERTATMLKRLGDHQKDCDILVVSAQFGLRHRGLSVRRAREVFAASEFGLGAFQIACMILTHPERLQHDDDLWIDCAGDEYAPDADRGFSDAPFFRFSDSGVGFGTGLLAYPRGRCGSVSGFVSQS